MNRQLSQISLGGETKLKQMTESKHTSIIKNKRRMFIYELIWRMGVV